MPTDSEEKCAYKVVVGYEGQYSIWRLDRPLPMGWREGGKSGTKQECIDHIRDFWSGCALLERFHHLRTSFRDLCYTGHPGLGSCCAVHFKRGRQGAVGIDFRSGRSLENLPKPMLSFTDSARLEGLDFGESGTFPR